MILAILFVILLVLGAVLYGSLSWGFVVYKFWNWFLIPVLAIALPDVVVMPMTYWGGVALFLFTIFFRLNGNSYSNEDKNWGLSILTPWAILLLGWFLKILLPI